jgi:hypothetical protein
MGGRDPPDRWPGRGRVREWKALVWGSVISEVGWLSLCGGPPQMSIFLAVFVNANHIYFQIVHNLTVLKEKSVSTGSADIPELSPC